MQIVIDIDESEFEAIQYQVASGHEHSYGYVAIANGTPLPKGHGALKDADKLKHAFIKWSMAVQGNFTDADIASIICNSPTIIEADKENKE